MGFSSYRLNSVLLSQYQWRVRDFCVLRVERFFACHRVDLPMKKYKLSNFISILMSSDGMYCGWSIRNFLRFVEFDLMGQKPCGEFCEPSDFKEDDIEYRALDFIFTNYCDEVIEKFDNDN